MYLTMPSLLFLIFKESLLTLKSVYSFQQAEFCAETELCKHVATLLILLIKAKGLNILVKDLVISVKTFRLLPS